MDNLPNQNKIDKLKMIVCDLDGTLLSHNKKITIRTQELLISLQQKGYILVLASGRFFYELQTYIDQLKMKTYGGIAICANGLEVHDLANNQTHYFQKLKQKEVVNLLIAAKKNHMIAYFNYNHKYYAYIRRSYQILLYMAKICLYPFRNLLKNNHLVSGLYQLGIINDDHQNFNELHKICFLSSPHKLKRFEKQITSWKQPYVFYYVNERITEIMHNSVGKYEAMQYVCHKKGFSLASVIAFGDSGNDLNLIKNAGIGVAMKNAFPEVKASTLYQTSKSNQQDGIYDYLLQLKLKSLK